MLSGGGALRWYRDTFQPAADYSAITSGAATAPAGCEGLIFLPYLTGERTPYADPDARGVFFGATLRSTQDWFARSVLEGVAYSVNDATALLTSLNVPINEVRAIGGGAKSTLWLQIMADVTNQKHVLPTLDEGPAAGAAILAAVGAGTFANVKDACAALVGTTPAATPGPDASTYAKWAPHYQALYPALQASFKAVARTAAGA
jgi:xylulokinase